MKEKMKKELSESKDFYAVLLVCCILTILFFIFQEKLVGEDSVFNDNISDIPVLNTIYHYIPLVLECIVIGFVAFLLVKLVQFVIEKLFSHSKGGITAAKLFASFAKYIIWLIALIMMLGTLGVNTTALVASAGIAALIIGLGAQSLIADVIAGLFIVFEGEYKVGDIIVIDGWRGTVLEIGIRTTRIVDAGGNVKIVNNSSIHAVINQTKQLSVAKAYISIEYGESLQRVELVIKNNLDNIKKAIPQIVEGPFYKGVDALGESSVDLLFMANCKEEDIYIVQRAMNRELKLLFDENNINIPFPQIVLNEPVTFEDANLTKKQEKTADKFVAEQQKLSKEMEEISE
ncbi:MAG: mechanosensitive ion channel family protein [Candidatus Methanomethylophilaceae archaeon]|nr:mechanosensitive ion channel family protein [Candidatus Methanomethylophilaceae archaeon]MBP5394875.1 mechanosensitive ion channel family protein [Candidatus Methanomethylophilaceae archaeon]